MKEDKESFSCRVCLRYEHDSYNTSKYLCIFESSNNNNYGLTKISDMIGLIAKVEINQGDGSPERICPDCYHELQNAIAFKHKCETSDSILRNTALRPFNGETLFIQVKEEKIEDDIEHAVDIQDPTEIHTEDYYSDVELKQEILVKKLTDKPNNYTTVECDDCGGIFKSKCKLRVHWKNIHKLEKLVCQKCYRTFKSYKAFNVHAKKPPSSCISASRSRIEGRGKSRIFYCKDCPYKTTRTKDMSTHLMTHTGERNFMCVKCSKTFTQQGSLQAHLECVHKEYSLETTCQYCGKLIKGRRKFYRHLQTHKAAEQQCKICNKVLKNKKGLYWHMFRHGSKTFHCEFCGKAYFTIAELCTHKAHKHLNRKKYTCDLCGYSVVAMATLKLHKSRHTGTNIPCLKCGYFFQNEEKLALHQRSHTERNYPCQHCDKTFHTSKNRSKHVTNKHKCLKVIRITRELEKESNSSILANGKETSNIKQEKQSD